MPALISPGAKLEAAIQACLEDIASEEFGLRWHQPMTSGQKDNSPADLSRINKAVSKYRETLQHGLLALLGQVNIPDSQTWQDAIEYARAVIESPEDTSERATSTWNRSCSDLHRELVTRYGPTTIAAARAGCARLISEHYQGDGLSISHVDKQASFKRRWRHAQVGAAFYPASSPLAVGCYEVGLLDCSISISVWCPPELAVQQSALGSLSICEDYGHFTASDYDVRLRLVAMGVGAAYAFGGRAVNALLDATALQACGNGEDMSARSAMAWRAVGGAGTPFSGFVFADDTLEGGLVMPEVLVAVHDLLDWRSDTAAGNHENGVSATYGMGFDDPFHTYLEAALQRAVSNPLSGAGAIAGVMYTHFTGSRYASYEYHGTHRHSCDECLRLVQEITAGAGLLWDPKAPPATFVEGMKMRELGKLWADRFEDHGLLQESFSWFQSLVSTGKIWLFDVLSKTVDSVDSTAGWA